MEENKSVVLLSSAYLPPVQYFAKFIEYPEVKIEAFEHFLKQSFRNRCNILTANGVQNLSIPVADGSNSKRLIRDVLISYDHSWQKLHWKALVSAYNNSPFFEYYSDDLLPFYTTRKWKFLLDFNMDLLGVLLNSLKIKISVRLTESFYPLNTGTNNLTDLRYSFHPKPGKQAIDLTFRPVDYPQVFQEKFGFIPNLSILDLLFNEGPESVSAIQKCIVR